MVTWWFYRNLIPRSVGYKEFTIAEAFNLVVWTSKQYDMLFGKEVSVTNMYFLEILKDEKDNEGLGRVI